MAGKTPVWLQNFDCKWDDKRLAGISDMVPGAMEGYLSCIGPNDWAETLEQFRNEEDNCICEDTGVTFSCNLSDNESEDDSNYSKKMVFCAGSLARDEVQSLHFLQFLKLALEKRQDQELPPVEGQEKFCDFVRKVEKGKLYDSDQGSSHCGDSSEQEREDRDDATSRRRWPLPHILWLPISLITTGARWLLGSDLSSRRSLNSLCVVFGPAMLTSDLQLHVYIIPNIIGLVKDLETFKSEESYTKWDLEPCVLTLGEKYHLDAHILKGECNSIRIYPNQFLISTDDQFFRTFRNEYPRKFRVIVDFPAIEPHSSLRVELQLKNEDGETVCEFQTKSQELITSKTRRFDETIPPTIIDIEEETLPVQPEDDISVYENAEDERWHKMESPVEPVMENRGIKELVSEVAIGLMSSTPESLKKNFFEYYGSNKEGLSMNLEEIKPVHQEVKVRKVTYTNQYGEELSNLAVTHSLTTHDRSGRRGITTASSITNGDKYIKPLPALKEATDTKEQKRKFHQTTHGSNVNIEHEGLVARSYDSSKNCICFSEQPIKIEEKIHLKTTKSGRFKGPTKIGFTSRDPGTIEELPMHSYPNLKPEDRFWIKPLPELYGHDGDVVTFCVDDSGRVFFSINGDNEVFFFDGVDVSKDLWAVMDIHGTAVAVTFEAPDEAVQTAPKIHVGDYVTLMNENMETLRILQHDHGGCPSDMEEGIGKKGIARDIDDNDNVTVCFPEIDKEWRLSPAVLQTVENVGADFATSLDGICNKHGHHLKKGLSRVCTRCEQCTSQGYECVMEGLPLRPRGSTCGCIHKGESCANCGICRTCAVMELHCHSLIIGDQVKVQVDEEAFRFLQKESKCDWKEEMMEVIGGTGEVTGLVGENSKAVTVTFPNGKRWDMSPDCLIKTTPAQRKEKESLKKGDLVKVLKDEEQLEKLQIGHGGYNKEMHTCLGKTGRVKKVKKHYVMVEIVGRKWCFNPAALSPTIADEEKTTHLREGDFVKVVVNEETFRNNQVGHGGQGDKMKDLMNEVGMVHKIDLDGDAIVCFPGGKWILNPLNLDKVNPDDCNSEDLSYVIEAIEVGDWVKVDANKDKIKAIQERTVPWSDGYYDAAGQVGRVTDSLQIKNIIRVSIKNAIYPLNSRLLKKATAKDMREAFAPAETQSPVFARGDLVKICTDLDKLKSQQQGHGEYSRHMEKVMDSIGSVRFIDVHGDVIVRFSLKRFRFNPEVLAKVGRTEETFHIGDMVLIEPDRSRFVSLQKDLKHGGYRQGMVMTCGKTGRILDIIDEGRVGVKVDGRGQIFNPDLLKRQGNPGLDRAVWKSSSLSICAPGKHDWSKGRCLVCVNCGECTQYGKQCPVRDRPGRIPGSICGCGDGHAGCDDCGFCKTCADEDSDSDSDSDDEPMASCTLS